MAAAKRLVEAYFDVLSPYSYLSFVLFNRCNKVWEKMELDFKPVLIGGLLKASGIEPPALSNQWKGRYIWKDMERLSAYYDIPYRRPKDLPNVLLKKGSLKPQRLLTAVKREYPQHLVGVANQIHARIWQKDQDIVDTSSLAEACKAAGLAGKDTEYLLGMITVDEIKGALAKTTSEALENGAYGLPTYILHVDGKKELFFGTDRMFLLANYMGEKWPVAKS